MTGEDGENQLIQLAPDGQAQLIQVTNSQGEPQFFQLAAPSGVQEYIQTDDGLLVQQDEHPASIDGDEEAAIGDGVQYIQIQDGQQTQVTPASRWLM